MDTLSALATFVSANAIWIGLILLYPVWVRLGAILRLFIMDWLKPQHKIIIRHVHNGTVLRSVEIDLDNDEPLVRQLRAIKEKQ